MVRPLSDSSEREHQSRRAWPLACRSKFLRWGRGTSIWKWRRCLPSCLGADDGVKPTLKNLSNNDGDDYENVTQNGNLSFFKPYRAYSISFNSSNVANFFLELNSKRLYGSSGKEKENRCLVFTSYRKREIRHFYVVVVQWRKKEIRRNVQKRVMHVQSCFFFFPIYTQCFFAVLSWRRRLRCPVLPLKVSLAVMRELKKYL